MGESNRDFDIWALLCQNPRHCLHARQPQFLVARAQHPGVRFLRFLVANVFFIENRSGFAADLATRL